MSDIGINEIMVARRHCLIDWDEKQSWHVLTVLGLNGAYLNDEFVCARDEPRVLCEGDEIRIGTTTLVYTWTG